MGETQQIDFKGKGGSPSGCHGTHGLCPKNALPMAETCPSPLSASALPPSHSRQLSSQPAHLTSNHCRQTGAIEQSKCKAMPLISANVIYYASASETEPTGDICSAIQARAQRPKCFRGVRASGLSISIFALAPSCPRWPRRSRAPPAASGPGGGRPVASGALFTYVCMARRPPFPSAPSPAEHSPQSLARAWSVKRLYKWEMKG